MPPAGKAAPRFIHAIYAVYGAFMIKNIMSYISRYDPEVGKAIELEYGRQRRNLELIASENAVSSQVVAAMATVLTNKYAEGYPGKRYYGGCEYVDIVENLARDRAKKMFGAKFVNVQPHSGVQANYSVYYALCQPGDTVMGMNLAHGGHLSHGSPANFSGKYYNIIPYGVDPETHTLDYENIRKLALEHKPKMIVAGASAYPRIIDFEKIGQIAKEAGAYLLVDIAHIAGLVVAGLHPNPLPHAHVVTTTTHKTLRGPRGGMVMCNDEAIAAKIDKAIFPGSQGGPLMHIIAAKAVAFGEALRPEFTEYQKQVVKNAKALAQGLMEEGFDLVSGGTDNHLMLVDLRKFNMTGKVMEKRMDEVYITANKNAIPNDPQKPNVTSGIRLGTPAITNRGLKEDNMRQIARLIYLTATDFEAKADYIRQSVNEICEAYPLYD